jgi:exodeoxyribonuclease V alpha subunit
MSASIFQALDALVEAGSLRQLAVSFSRFIATLGKECPKLAICSAVLSEMEGRGHSCLLLDELAADPCGLLGWPAEDWEVIRAAAGRLPETAEEWRKALADCRQVWVADEGEDRQQPLILEGSRIYLRRYWRHEQDVVRTIVSRVGQDREVDVAQVRAWLDRLFDPSPQPGPDWQKIACAVAMRNHFTLITGGPGTGKTFTVARLLTLLFAMADDASRLRIALAAPTGKAAARLKQSIADALEGLSKKMQGVLPLAALADRLPAAVTLHSLLGAQPDRRRARHHAGNPLDVDVVIVDEASMVHLEMAAALLDAVPPNAMLILLGDKDQLASVEAGSVLGDLCRDARLGCYAEATVEYVSQAAGETIPVELVCGGGPLAQQTVMLRTSRRFQGAIGALAAAVNEGDGPAACDCLRQGDAPAVAWMERATHAQLLNLALEGRMDVSHSYFAYLALLRQPPAGTEADRMQWIRTILASFDRFRILCATREGEWGVAGINQAVEQFLAQKGHIRRSGEWYSGRPVMVMRNDYGMGVFNGDIGITLPDPVRNGSLRVYFPDGEGCRSVLASRLPAIDTAYAMTVHKSQGSEFTHVALALPQEINPVLSRELIYTGITRARAAFTLVTPDAAVFSQAVEQKTRRASGLRDLLEASGH